MVNILCKACGTAYSVKHGKPDRCSICEDERQFVPVSGQEWISPETLHSNHRNQWQQLTPTLLTLESVPSFAIGQRAFVLITPAGNILWDCIANLDEATRTLISALGGLKAIAISHPHYYSTMQDWAEAFNAPIYLHADDRQWIVRDSPRIQLWQGDTYRLDEDIQLIRLGGHFAGGTVLHHAKGKGMLLSGDIIQVAPGGQSVSFMWSYPNMLPLSAATVNDIAQRLQHIEFDVIHGAFTGRDVYGDGALIVQRSAKKYVECLG